MSVEPRRLASQPLIPASATNGCLVCRLSLDRCARPAVDGWLLQAKVGSWRDQFYGYLLLEAEDGEQIRLALLDPWTDVARVCQELGNRPRQRVRVRAYHLQPFERDYWLADARSLLVLDADRLINVTELAQAEYCAYQDWARQLVAEPPREPQVLGNAVHAAFERRLRQGQVAPGDLSEALAGQALSMALLGLEPHQVAQTAQPHVERLDAWCLSPGSGLATGEPRTETLILAPELGLRARVDALIAGDGRTELLELKTGKGTARGSHQRDGLQVVAYQAVLHVRERAEGLRGRLLYSVRDPDTMAVEVPFTVEDLQKATVLRNALAAVHLVGRATRRPSERQCQRCTIEARCRSLCALTGRNYCRTLGRDDQESPEWSPADQQFYRQYLALLAEESRQVEEAQSELWRLPLAERVALGRAAGPLLLAAPPTLHEDGWWRHSLTGENVSELRPGDGVLLHDGDPVRGRVVTGRVVAARPGELVIRAREPLPAARAVDLYDPDVVDRRIRQGLWAWLEETSPRQRALVYGQRPPEFRPIRQQDWPGCNPSQSEAISRALAARDYLLIQGPPGTGKTRTIAYLVKALLAERPDRRVLLAAYTNQAVDNLVRALLAAGCADVLRLGSGGDPALDDVRLDSGAADALTRLRRARALASTAATWAFPEYSQLRGEIVIVDEASQLTVPASLAPLRLADRFVLVGDERQLPPVVQSEAALAGGLGRSLFEELRETARVNGALVLLQEQYRMARAIRQFPGEHFYGGSLSEPSDVAAQRLGWPDPGADSFASRTLDPACPLVFIDTADYSARGKRSLVEAETVQRLVASLQQGGLAPEQVGVIAPFRAQVSLIRQTLDDERWTVDTVDRFQGGERDVILLSLAAPRTRGQQDRLARFLADERRLNVALTRARAKLVVIADEAGLATMPLYRAWLESVRADPEARWLTLDGLP